MHGVAFIGYLLILLAVLQSVFIFGIYALNMDIKCADFRRKAPHWLAGGFLFLLGGLILALVTETRVEAYASAFVMLTGLAYIALFLVQGYLSTDCIKRMIGMINNKI